eukprot:14684-Heterococcus_DN1.PRE.1
MVCKRSLTASFCGLNSSLLQIAARDSGEDPLELMFISLIALINRSSEIKCHIHKILLKLCACAQQAMRQLSCASAALGA